MGVREQTKHRNYKMYCENARQKRKAKRMALGEYKVQQGCMDCGYAAHPDALQFDHVRGEKLFNVAQGAHRSQKLLEAEIAKCDIVCANCHAVRTASRREWI